MSSFLTKHDLVLTTSTDEAQRTHSATIVSAVEKVQPWFLQAGLNLMVFYYTLLRPLSQAHIAYILYAVYTVVEAIVLAKPTQRIVLLDSDLATHPEAAAMARPAALFSVAVIAIMTAVILGVALHAPQIVLRVLAVPALVHQVRHYYRRYRSVKEASRLIRATN